MTRRELRRRLRLTYGVPVAAMLDLAGIGAGIPEAQKWTLAFTAEYVLQDANIENYAYDNKKLQVMLMRRWEF